MWKNFLNLFKRNSNQVVHIGTNNKGVSVFRETFKDGTVRTWSEKLGKVWRETIQKPVKDMGANSKQKITKCINHENCVTTNIEHRLNVYKEAGDRPGFCYDSSVLSNITGLKIPKNGRYDIIYKTSNDFEKGAVNKALTVVGKDVVGSCKAMSKGSMMDSKYIKQEFIHKPGTMRV